MNIENSASPRIYLDHAATTPLDQEVLEAMVPYLTERYGNPSSVHKFGQEAHVGLNTARETAAAALHCQPDEILFTGCATESNNTILKGYATTHQSAGRHIITSAIEHDSVLESCAQLECDGYDITYLPPNSEGLIEPETLKNALRSDTIMISIMAANNEIGTIQPIAELSRIAHERGIFFHTDAVQYYPYFPCSVGTRHALSLPDVDALTLSAHKFFGPKGVGLLYLKKGTDIAPLLHGGGQEFDLRAGTQNVAGIVGMAKAMELVEQNREQESGYIRILRDALLNDILENIPDVWVNGSIKDRLPNNLNLSIEGVKGETLMIRLDLAGIAVSTGSACSIFDHKASHVLTSLGLNPETADSSIRISLSKYSTPEELDYVVQILSTEVAKLRELNNA